MEDLHDAVLVGQDRGQARVIAPHEGDAARGRLFFQEQGHALEELMDVEGHDAEGDGAPDVQQHLDDAVDAGHLFQEHGRVLAPPRLVAQLALHELRGAADGRERVADLVGEPYGHLPRRGQSLPAADLGLELAQARDVAHHRHRRDDGAAASGERRRDHAHVHGTAVEPLDDGGGLGPALAGGQRVGQVAHEGCLGGEDFLEGAAEHAPGGAAQQVLGRGIPQDDAQLGVHAHEGIRQPAHQPLVVERMAHHQASARSGTAFRVRGARSPASSRS